MINILNLESRKREIEQRKLNFFTVIERYVQHIIFVKLSVIIKLILKENKKKEKERAFE